MAVKKTEKIWHNGKFINWDDAQVHVVSHVISYGSAVFEGIRCYKTTLGPGIFRLRDHMQRLLNSARIYRMDLPFSLDELCQAGTELVRVNKMGACYLRPIVLRGYGEVGVNPFNSPIDTYMACSPNTLPQMSKSAANYMNSQLIRMEAMVNGYVEGIALDVHGYVSEGSGENIFIVMDGVVLTPPLANCVLPGITRHTVLTLCRDMNIPVAEQMLPREMLYVADEVFFSGTAAEITPIRSIDKIKIGNGSRGPMTKRLQEEFFALTGGTKPDRYGWLTPVGIPVDATFR